jgi:DNA polymerase III delta prime subunit|tara:strand:+ start:1077 stop:1520 length:444 start_codon:yes stop_codon:yes gene_type:complete
MTMKYVKDKIEKSKFNRNDIIKTIKYDLDKVKDILNTEIYFTIDGEDSYEFTMVDFLKSLEDGNMKCYEYGRQDKPVNPQLFFENLSIYMNDYKYWEVERLYDYLDMNSELNEKIKEVEELKSLIRKMNEVVLTSGVDLNKIRGSNG